jgi:hypothetical protein
MKTSPACAASTEMWIELYVPPEASTSILQRSSGFAEKNGTSEGALRRSSDRASERRDPKPDTASRAAERPAEVCAEQKPATKGKD